MTTDKPDTIRPGDLRVGDRVRTGLATGLVPGRIFAINANKAWVFWPSGANSIIDLSDLERADQKEGG